MAALDVVTPLAPGTPDPQRETWIRKTPGVCGGNACIRNTRITVWGLVVWKRLGMPENEMIAEIQGLTREDVAAAWRYAEAHPEEIETAVRENEEA